LKHSPHSPALTGSQPLAWLPRLPLGHSQSLLLEDEMTDISKIMTMHGIRQITQWLDDDGIQRFSVRLVSAPSCDWVGFGRSVGEAYDAADAIRQTWRAAA
jgi:hypothetical protein